MTVHFCSNNLFSKLNLKPEGFLNFGKLYLVHSLRDLAKMT